MKAYVAVAAKERLVEELRSPPGSPCDEHTLGIALEQAEILTATTPSIVLADRAYRKMKTSDPAKRLNLSHTRRPLLTLKQLLRRHQIVEVAIRHGKTKRQLDHNWLRRGLVEALHAVICGAKHNSSLIQARLTALPCTLVAVQAELEDSPGRSKGNAIGAQNRIETT